MGALLLAAGVVLNTVSNILFKAGAGIGDLAFRKWLLIGSGFFVGFVGTLGYVKSLEKIDLATAFPVFSAATIVLVAIASVFLFHESLSMQKGIGVVVLCAGLLLIWRG